MISNYDYLIKIIIIGDSNVGKSSISSMFVDNVIKLDYDTTIGVDFFTKIIPVDDKDIKLQIWDTAGQERFLSITKSYYRSVNSVLIVFDVTHRKSFLNIKKWLKEIKNNGVENPTVFLVGNKIDSMEKRQISYDEAFQLAEENNIEYIECSAKTNNHIYDLFEKLAKKTIYNKKDSLKINDYKVKTKESKDCNTWKCCS
jgi:small GTP-binding protein